MASTEQKISLIGSTPEELKGHLAPFAQPAYRVNQIYQWLHHYQVDTFDEMTNLPKSLRKALQENFQVGSLSMASRQDSMDGTIKYLWKLRSGYSIESVFIPEEKRKTICISSQVGCALGCGFCATAQMGFLSNLTAGEIVEQIIRVQADTGEKITNVVLMGMGEPFLNYARVIQACHIMSSPEGLAISAKKITISTVGVVPRIIQFAKEQQPFSLAISLHAPTQALRRQFMPIAEKFSLDELMESARFYTDQTTRKRITFEYVLLEDVNDSEKEARKLLHLLSPLRCKLNLIPYNDTGLGYHLPGKSRIDKFVTALYRAPFSVTLRKNRGNDIAAACGQLFFKSETEKNPRFIKSGQPVSTT